MNEPWYEDGSLEGKIWKAERRMIVARDEALRLRACLDGWEFSKTSRDYYNLLGQYLTAYDEYRAQETLWQVLLMEQAKEADWAAFAAVPSVANYNRYRQTWWAWNEETKRLYEIQMMEAYR